MMDEEVYRELIIGKPAPHFSGTCYCKDCGGDGFCEVDLADYEGKWLVLFFFPAAFTGVCNSEVKAFAEHEAEFTKAGAELLGATGDTQFVMKKLVESGEVGDVGYKLLSDPTHRIGRAYGTYNEEVGLNFRGLFIIDPKGILRYAVYHEPFVGRSTDETLRVLKALQTGEACPMDWRP